MEQDALSNFFSTSARGKARRNCVPCHGTAEKQSKNQLHSSHRWLTSDSWLKEASAFSKLFAFSDCKRKRLSVALPKVVRSLTFGHLLYYNSGKRPLPVLGHSLRQDAQVTFSGHSTSKPIANPIVWYAPSQSPMQVQTSIPISIPIPRMCFEHGYHDVV